MGRMLDAVERARQERLKRLQSGGRDAAGANAPSPAPNLDALPAVAAPAGPAPAPATVAVGLSDRLVGAHDEQSPIAEQVRHIRTNLETVLADHRTSSIVITSPVAGEGKTLVACNLAAVLADDPSQQVLLIDADMRKPGVNELFGTRLAPGLSEHLRGQCPWREAVHATGLPNLKVMPAGRLPHRPSNPTVLLGSDLLATMLDEARSIFRWIVFDTPPLLPVTDAAVLARRCTGLILVLRLGRTHYNQVQRAQELLAEARVPVLGCILNDLTTINSGSEYYHQYYRRQDSKVEA